jgi:hypothetical protein
VSDIQEDDSHAVPPNRTSPVGELLPKFVPDTVSETPPAFARFTGEVIPGDGDPAAGENCNVKPDRTTAKATDQACRRISTEACEPLQTGFRGLLSHFDIRIIWNGRKHLMPNRLHWPIAFAAAHKRLQ